MPPHLLVAADGPQGDPLYDVEMKPWCDLSNSARLRRLCPWPFDAGWCSEVLDAVHQGEVDTWDSEWAFAKLRCAGLKVVPVVNLVSNIGFGQDSTHTVNSSDLLAELATQNLLSPWQHGDRGIMWQQADRVCLTHVVGVPGSFWSRWGLRSILRTLLQQ